MIEYADGLKAIPICVPGTSKSVREFPVTQYFQSATPSCRVYIAVSKIFFGMSRLSESMKLQVQRPV